MDNSLGSLETVLSVLDFSTIKNEVFPLVASVFSKTISLGINIRGPAAFVVLCGGTKAGNNDLGDGLDGALSANQDSTTKNTAILDKYTVQEKIVPLIRAIKTKEPAVMTAALAVFKQVAKIADADFLAIEVLPILWSFSLGPLLNLDQFQQYMTLIKSVSAKIENEQMRKLHELSSNHGTTTSTSQTQRSTITTNGLDRLNSASDVLEDDFQKLVLGKGGSSDGDILGDGWASQSQKPQQKSQEPPMFSWSTPATQSNQNQHLSSSAFSALQNSSNVGSRAITPDHTLTSFATLSPAPRAGNTMTLGAGGFNALTPSQSVSGGNNTWASTNTAPPAVMTRAPSYQSQPTFNIPAPTQPGNSAFSSFSIAPPPAGTSRSATSTQVNGGLGKGIPPSAPRPAPSTAQTALPKKGLDAYESLI